MARKFTAGILLRSRGFAATAAIVCTLLIWGGLTYFYFIYPHTRIGPRQPIPFSHRIHAGVKEIDCRFCHPSVERAYYAGIPSAEKCLFCHKYIITSHPYIRDLRSYADRGEAVRWQRVVWVPDHVYFSHQRHIRKEVECVSCHGAVETMDRIYDPHPKIMGFCVTCHREQKAGLDCWTCHK
jgi:hypothetical protein